MAIRIVGVDLPQKTGQMIKLQKYVKSLALSTR